jgi:hypothetical protein
MAPIQGQLGAQEANREPLKPATLWVLRARVASVREKDRKDQKDRKARKDQKKDTRIGESFGPFGPTVFLLKKSDKNLLIGEVNNGRYGCGCSDWCRLALRWITRRTRFTRPSLAL